MHLCVALAAVVVQCPRRAVTIAQAPSQPSIRERPPRVADCVPGARSHRGRHPGAQGDPRSSRIPPRRIFSASYRTAGSPPRSPKRKRSSFRQPLTSFVPAVSSRQHVSGTGRLAQAKGRNGERPDPGPGRLQFLAILGEAERSTNPKRSAELTSPGAAGRRLFAQARHYLALALSICSEEAVRELSESFRRVPKSRNPTSSWNRISKRAALTPRCRRPSGIQTIPSVPTSDSLARVQAERPVPLAGNNRAVAPANAPALIHTASSRWTRISLRRVS